jgi:hypothetical protein
MEEDLEREKERSRAREQEAFTARYQIVGVQEQLEQALERIKLVEQERDAFKTAAKNEEVARIAAEGRIPLPPTASPDDEFASPKKLKVRQGKEPRVSLSTMEILSSEASELEIEDLTLQVRWEKQRADRAEEMIEFLQAECEMHCCACSKSRSKSSTEPQQHEQAQPPAVEKITDSADALDPMDTDLDSGAESKTTTDTSDPMDTDVELAIESKTTTDAEDEDEIEDDTIQHHEQEIPEAAIVIPSVEEPSTEPTQLRSKKEPRRSTIFCPREGIFRTVSEQEAAVLEAQKESHTTLEVQDNVNATSADLLDVAERNSRMYARTPSVDPPDFALLAQERMSLASLLNAPHSDAHTAPLPNIPTYSAEDEAASVGVRESAFQPPRPHTSAAAYTITTTTTTVPIRDENDRTDSTFAEKLRTPSNCSNASFDLNDPALTPTMTREQALAKIRERRGRARSAAQGAATPHKKMVEGKEKRHMSAPTTKNSGKPRRS